MSSLLRSSILAYIARLDTWPRAHTRAWAISTLEDYDGRKAAMKGSKREDLQIKHVESSSIVPIKAQLFQSGRDTTHQFDVKPADTGVSPDSRKRSLVVDGIPSARSYNKTRPAADSEGYTYKGYYTDLPNSSI